MSMLENISVAFFLLIPSIDNAVSESGSTKDIGISLNYSSHVDEITVNAPIKYLDVTLTQQAKNISVNVEFITCNDSSGGDTSLDKIAGEIINGGFATAIQNDGRAYKFDITNPDHFLNYLGLANNAAITGANIRIIPSGKFYNPGASYMPAKPYFIGVGGTITTNPPSVGWCKQVGVGLDENNILLNNHCEMQLIN